MQNVERLLVSCARPSGSGATRKMIGFKSRSSFKRCARELSKRGLGPVKLIRGGFILCCNLSRSEASRFNQLLHHPDIRFVEPDFKIRAHARPAPFGKAEASDAAIKRGKRTRPFLRRGRIGPLPLRGRAHESAEGTTWNVSRVQAPKVWKRTKGDGVPVAIIDTGIAPHPDLHIAGGVNTIGGRSYTDDNGHGTHVAGIAAALGTNGMIPGVAPKVKLFAVKALDAAGEGYISSIIDGIDWCIRNGMKVINMSFGLSGATSSALRQSIQRARRKGIVVIASAGNGGIFSGGIDEPASFPETIAVAASTIQNQIASFSSRGKGIDVAAPGTAIKSTWPGGGYKTLSGTSMASPHVAGGAALLLAINPKLRPYQISRKLRNTALKLSGFSSRSQGAGLIRLARAAKVSRSGSGAARRRRSK
ncbi:S8 family peptidase [Paenibacillus humicola]|uniref:S8 family peptidase n=1 Tax=Paenibacillus humicola TaxID=3110540 RepID=UPI00237A1EF6|nr:S8 family peptidase [Paenibacillus humicola]